MAIARGLFDEFSEPKLWLLSGDLGSGKTTFVKGLAKRFGLTERGIKSPTFTFVNEYPQMVHCDLYRLEGEDPLLIELLEEHAAGKRLLLVEWPEKMIHLAQKNHLRILFEVLNETDRLIEIESVHPHA